MNQKNDAAPALLRLNVKKVIEFFDTSPDGSQGNTTAINAVLGEDLGAAAFRHFARRSGLGDVEILEGTPTPGSNKGKRLDRWLLLSRHDGSQLLFQAEIKSWAAHALGSGTLSVKPGDAEYSDYAKKRWARTWNEEDSILSMDTVSKVLLPMKRPEFVDESVPIAPLLIFWYVTHPEGKREPYFQREFSGECPFPERLLHFFSTSAYLRTLNEEYLDLPMPHAVTRISWLNQIGQPI